MAYSSKSRLNSHRRGGTYQRGSATLLTSNPTDPALLGANRPHYNAPDENVCRLLSCDFENGHMCLYSSARIASSVSMFQPFNNTAHTVLFARNRISMLQSIIFRLNAPARLHFSYTIKVN